MQKRRNSITNTLELRLSCINSLIWDSFCVSTWRRTGTYKCNYTDDFPEIQSFDFIFGINLSKLWIK